MAPVPGHKKASAGDPEGPPAAYSAIALNPFGFAPALGGAGFGFGTSWRQR